MTLMEVNAASEAVTSIASPDANVIFGAVVDEKYEGDSDSDSDGDSDNDNDNNDSNSNDSDSDSDSDNDSDTDSDISDRRY